MRPTLESYRHVASGKVRELYEIDDDTLLMVSTDRISAYDHVLDSLIPDKGRVLTAMSFFWFETLGIANHLVGGPDDPRIPDAELGRSMVVRKLPMLPVDCVARGYLTGSGLLDYRATGSVCGIGLPSGLQEASRLPMPIFTPASKAAIGDHDENIDFAGSSSAWGSRRRAHCGTPPWTSTCGCRARGGTRDHPRRHQVRVRSRPRRVAGARRRGADAGLVTVLDAGIHTPGVVQPSFDKQIVRNWLTGPESGWDRTGSAPPPPLPDDLVARTRARYIEAYETVSGRSFAQCRVVCVTERPAVPTAKTIPTEREHHGDVVVDEYEWLRDKDDPEVIAFLEAQNALTEADTAELADLRSTIVGEIKARTRRPTCRCPCAAVGTGTTHAPSREKQYGISCRCPIRGDNDWDPPTVGDDRSTVRPSCSTRMSRPRAPTSTRSDRSR